MSTQTLGNINPWDSHSLDIFRNIIRISNQGRRVPFLRTLNDWFKLWYKGVKLLLRAVANQGENIDRDLKYLITIPLIDAQKLTIYEKIKPLVEEGKLSITVSDDNLEIYNNTDSRASFSIKIPQNPKHQHIIDSIRQISDFSSKEEVEIRGKSAIDLNRPVESFLGKEKELYDEIPNQDNSEDVLTIIRLLTSLSNESADSWLKNLFISNRFEESKPKSPESIEVIQESLFSIFPNLANRYIKEDRQKLVQFVEEILNNGTQKAREACLFWLQSYNSPELAEPLLKFSYETLESDPQKSKLAMWLATEYVEEIQQTKDFLIEAKLFA